MSDEAGGRGATSKVAFGTMALTSLYNPHADLAESEAALQLALDRGVRVLHTAQHYGDGRAFELTRRVLATHAAGGEAGVVAKIDGSPARVRDGREGVLPTLAALDREHLERAQLVESLPGQDEHWTPDDILDDLASQGRLFELVSRLVEENAVGEVGIEAYGLEHVQRAAELPLLRFVVCDVSAMRQVVPLDRVPGPVARGELAVIAIRPLAGGWLTDRYRCLDDFAPADNRRDWYAVGEGYRDAVAPLFERHGLPMLVGALRFLHSLPYVEQIVVGMRTVAQVEAALDPRCSEPLPAEVVEEIAALFPQPVEIELD